MADYNKLETFFLESERKCAVMEGHIDNAIKSKQGRGLFEDRSVAVLKECKELLKGVMHSYKEAQVLLAGATAGKTPSAEENQANTSTFGTGSGR